MADIIPLAGLFVSTTVNGVTVRLTRGRLRIGAQVIQFATTGQTLDADLKAWLNTLAGGANSWELEGDGYIDYNVSPANRITGANIRMRPGLLATVIVLLGPAYGFSGIIVVDQFEASWDAEGTKPVAVRVGGKGDGPPTYINA